MLLGLMSWIHNRKQENHFHFPGEVRIAVLGAGCGALPNALIDLDLEVDTRVCAVEIDSNVLKLGEQFFGFRERKDLEIVCGDALGYIRSTVADQFSVVFLDIANLDNGDKYVAPPVGFCNHTFIQKLYDSMISGSLLAINILGGISQLLYVYDRYRKCFEDVWALQLPSQTILYAQKGGPCCKRIQDVVGELHGHNVQILGSTLQQIRICETSTENEMGWLNSSRLDGLVGVSETEKNSL